MWLLTTLCNSSSWGSNALSWSPQTPGTHKVRIHIWRPTRLHTKWREIVLKMRSRLQGHFLWECSQRSLWNKERSEWMLHRPGKFNPWSWMVWGGFLGLFRVKIFSAQLPLQRSPKKALQARTNLPFSWKFTEKKPKGYFTSKLISVYFFKMEVILKPQGEVIRGLSDLSPRPAQGNHGINKHLWSQSQLPL